MKLPLHEYRAITFDCFGTLIDWETGILTVLRAWAVRHRLETNDDKLLAAFSRAEPVEEHKKPGSLYSEILAGVMHRIADDFNASASNDDAKTLAESVGQWPVFPDTAAALTELQSRAKLIVVSNVDATSFAGAAPKLGITLDGVVTAEEVGAYKPDVKMFRRALEVVAELDVLPREHLHVAQSLHHDIVPATGLGISTCWIDRRAGKPGGATPEPTSAPRPDYMFTSMEELAAAVVRSEVAARPSLQDEEPDPA